MRTRNWLAGLAAASLLAAPAVAQTTVGFGGADPTQIVNQPVVLPGQPFGQPQTLPFTGFSLSSLLPKNPFPLGKSLFGQSTFPTAANMPGKAYLQNFGYSRPQPIQ
jgi:hypothetical protein